MTLAAPKSRRGRFTLVLALLAALVAVGGMFLWSNTTQADMPTTIVTLTQSPAAPGTVNPGQTITYTMVASMTGVNTSGAIVATITLGTGVQNSTSAVTCTGAGGGVTWTAAGGTTGTLTCTASGVLTTSPSSLTMVVTVDAAASGPANPPTLADIHDGAGSPVAATSGASVGPLTVSGVTTTGGGNVIAGGTNVISFTIPAGLTFCSDVTLAGALREFSASDLVVNPPTALVSGPTGVSPLSSEALPVTVTVTVTSATVGSSVTATLFTHLATSTVTTDCGTGTVVTANFTAPTGGFLRHNDLADAASEDAGGTAVDGDSLCTNSKTACGLLAAQDDVDDAQGSFHGACIEGAGLTLAANGAQITWSITPVAGGPAPQSIVPYAGPISGEPCVMWSVGSTGTQDITATWTSGGTSVVFFFNGSCTGGTCMSAPGTPAPITNPVPLIKEWNTIDSTSITNAGAGSTASTTGNDVGDTLKTNTGRLADWMTRDCENLTTPPCNAVNLSGQTIDQSGVLITGPIHFGMVDAAGASFIDYTFGSHNDAGGAYNGPVDGASQTYTLSGTCGSVRLENPATGNVIILDDSGEHATVLSSDKGVGFEILPNSAGTILTTPPNANCVPGDSTTVTITTIEANLFHSPPALTTSTETITIRWIVGPPTNKTPLLAWAGQRIVLEHDWSQKDSSGADVSCPWTGQEPPPGLAIGVRYEKLRGNGGFVGPIGSLQTGPDFIIVPLGQDCVSRAIYESEDQGEEDIVAHVVIFALGGRDGPVGAVTSTVDGIINPSGVVEIVSQQVAFAVFYMKFEDVKLTLVPGARAGHNSGNFSSVGLDTAANGLPTTSDVTSMTGSNAVNVSQDVLMRARVRGWLVKDDCPARDSGVDSNGSFLPANRCIFPDDWQHTAGGAIATGPGINRANYDIWGALPNCQYPPAGPFSLIDTGPKCEGIAPLVGGQVRQTSFPDGSINAGDAPMPPALVQLALAAGNAGFIAPANKADVYNNTNQFFVTHIPDNRLISPINEDLTGYQWNTWGGPPFSGCNGVGPTPRDPGGLNCKTGLYENWTSLAGHSVDSALADQSIVSCPGATTPGCAGGKDTGGYSWIQVYSDNHGEAMAWANGDANLDFSNCTSKAPATTPGGSKIVLLSGFVCSQGTSVGTTNLTAEVDYPDKRKHEPIACNVPSGQTGCADIEWTWGGIKEVTKVSDVANPQFSYVVLHVTDRDGFCGSSPSLHPVLGEAVNFLIDSPDGIIVPDANGNPAALLGTWTSKSADVTTFDTAANADIASGGITVTPTLVDGECQAWIHISSSLLATVDVLVTAHDPEGTPTFDVTFSNATPTPTPSPSPTPAPNSKWGDINCDKNVDTIDALGGLRFVVGFDVQQTGPCHAIGGTVSVDGTSEKFGDWNCDGKVDALDALYVLRFVAGMPLATPSGCPAVGAAVNIN